MTINLRKKKTGQEVRVHSLVSKTFTWLGGKGPGNEFGEYARQLIINNYSPKQRWLAVDGKQSLKEEANNVQLDNEDTQRSKLNSHEQ